MTLMRSQIRSSHLVSLGMFAVAASGCGLVFSQAPPAGHERMTSFTCTDHNTGPILDIVWGSLNVLGALSAASDPGAYENSDQIVAVGLGWGVVSGFSAASGFGKSEQCRRALRQLAGRQMAPGALATTPAITTPTIGSVVQAVVLTPFADTLVIGERVQLIATAHRSSGMVVPDRAFAWVSSNDAIASVNDAGLVTAHAAGAVVIAATTENVVGRANIVVVTAR